jgi:hypothetical protein
MDQHNAHLTLAAKIEYAYMESGDDVDLRAMAETGGVSGKTSVNSPRLLEATGGFASSGTWSESLHTYTMIITEDAYYTFRDHLLFAYPGNPGGKSSWSNPLGVVPVISVPFIDIAEDMGLPSFHSVLETLDSINELLSLMGNIIQNNGEPILVAYNINPQSVITKGTTADGTPVWYIPPPPNFGLLQSAAPPRLEYLSIDASNIGAMLEMIERVHADVKRALPESILDQDSAASGTSSGYQGTLLYQGLSAKLGRIRKTDFLATERAAQMALVCDDIKRRKSDGTKLLEAAKQKYDLVVQADPVLPVDQQQEAASQATDMSNNLLSHKRVLILRGYTEQKADEILKQVDDEKLNAARIEAQQAVILAGAQQKIAQQAQEAQMAVTEANVSALERAVTAMGGPNADPALLVQALSAIGAKPAAAPGAPGSPGVPAAPGAPKPGQGPTTTGKGPTVPTPPKPGGPAASARKSGTQPGRIRTGPRTRRANPGRKS